MVRNVVLQYAASNAVQFTSFLVEVCMRGVGVGLLNVATETVMKWELLA